ncbi:hypothetical protein [Pseudomonas arsenicoxydans]|uniref:Uncharacterized protein n=1 Tax=Pseudomonas arsenicoxydans TaxID=702115 RepID=A0A4P6G588_9PSED|nr:hypothetical protein [Pseudomonas arsenicoxydans]QAY84642.1 hypothetical protein CUN61_11860 [Pseudomonas arsenicoxydans]
MTSRELDRDVTAADEAMRQAVDALRHYHEAPSSAPLEELERLKADAEAKFTSASLCQQRVLSGFTKRLH